MMKKIFDNLSAVQRAVARELQDQFNIKFSEYWLFSETELHQIAPDEDFLASHVHVSELKDVVEAGAKLTKIANIHASNLSREDRSAYRDALLRNLSEF